jgi:DNA-binding SARP family transcriptional activator
MTRLSIHLFGPPQIALDNTPITDLGSDKARALLFYLATEPDRPHRREALAGLLWPDYPEQSARTSLRRALADLRKAISDQQQSPSFLCVSRQTIQLSADADIWCDVTAFSAALEAGRDSQSMDHLADGVDLYRGGYLEGFSIGDSAVFEEWALLKKEYFHRQALSALQQLAAYHEARSEYKRALPYVWRQLDLEPWHEEAHRQGMRLLALNNQRGAALAHYEVCRRTLAEELAVEPSSETVRLYEQIRSGELTMPRSAPTVPPVQTGSKRRAPGDRRLIIAGLALLLVTAVLAAAVAWALNGRAGQEASAKATIPIAAQTSGGKFVDVCELANPTAICVTDAATRRYRSISPDLDPGHVGPGLSWSPDGKRIAFDAGSDPAVGVMDHKLYTMGADGSDLKQITSGDTHDAGPAWSPEGEWIVFAREETLWKIRPDGSEPTHLWGQPGEVRVMGIAWSIDSQRIAFLSTSLDMTTSEGTVLRTIKPDGTDARMVYTLDEVLHGGSLGWSPDSEQIVCHCGFADEERFVLFDLDGEDEPKAPAYAPISWCNAYWPQWDLPVDE